MNGRPYSSTPSPSSKSVDMSSSGSLWSIPSSPSKELDIEFEPNVSIDCL